MNQNPPIICIMGPTASGKTALALEIAEQIPVEIISVDSALIYRQMDIGTAKPDLVMRREIEHHLIDICDPVESYSAAQFANDALHLLREISNSNKIPLLVGGTMLYYQALLKGMSELPSADAATRAKLDAKLAKLGSPLLHQQLKKIDPEAAKNIHPNDPQRIQRALEVFEVSGKPISEWWQEQKNYQLPYKVLKLATMPAERSTLHQIIEKRFDEMLDQGFVEEVKKLKSRGDLDLDKPSMRCVGYRQIWQYLDEEFDFETMREKGIAATRQLAKRQITWLRRESNLNWVNTIDTNFKKQAMDLIKNHLS